MGPAPAIEVRGLSHSYGERRALDGVEFSVEAGTIFGSKAVGEPPLMLAISVREAIRDAIAAFGAGGPVSLESPATPERVFFAVQRARAEREAQVSPVGATE